VLPDVCGDQGTASLGIGLSWPFQACTELILKICSQGPTNDLFWQECNETSYVQWEIDGCINYALVSVGGFDPSFVRFEAVEQYYGLTMEGASRIIFTNGAYDPWSSGGVNESSPGMHDNRQRHLFAYLLDGGAHHLDLRQPNTCDPPNVVEARRQITSILKCWANQPLLDGATGDCSDGTTLQRDLPPFVKVNDQVGAAGGVCQSVFFNYPWTNATGGGGGNGGNGGVGHNVLGLWSSLAIVVAGMLLMG